MKNGVFCSLACALVLVGGCGDEPTDVDVVVSSLDFGLTDCGTSPIPRALVVTNNSPDAFNFTTSLSGGADSMYVVVPSAGAVLPRSQVTLMVIGRPIPATSEVTDNLYGETLTVTTDKPGDTPHEVAISQTARGAILTADAEVIFASDQPLGADPDEQAFTISNSGNAAVTVTVESSAPAFQFAPGGAQTIDAGADLAGTIEFSARVTSTEAANLTVTATGPLCGPLPTAVASGRGTLAGLAAQAVPALATGRSRRGGGTGTLCVRTSTGVVACSGRNSYGMRGATDEYLATLIGTTQGGGGPPVGYNQFGTFNLVQTADSILTDVVELAAGRGFYCARREDATVWCWGAFFGSGLDQDTPAFQPFAFQAFEDVTRLSAGYSNVCTIDDGAVLSCVSHDSGSGGNFPRVGWAMTSATSVSVGGGTGYGVRNDGVVLSFGRNSQGERGNGDGDQVPASEVQNLIGVTQVAAGGQTTPNRGRRFACARQTDGTAWCWGSNRHGSLGNTTGDTNTPVQVLDETDTPLSGVTAIAAGQSHACALQGGTVRCWGRGEEGQVGSGTTSDSNSRAVLTSPSITNAASLGLGGRASCAVLTTGALRCWGELGGSRRFEPTVVDAFEP